MNWHLLAGIVAYLVVGYAIAGLFYREEPNDDSYPWAIFWLFWWLAIIIMWIYNIQDCRFSLKHWLFAPFKRRDKK
jgi:hypothetical protein